MKNQINLVISEMQPIFSFLEKDTKKLIIDN